MLNWVEVDLKKIKNNILKLKDFLGAKTKLLAVVKANAYGHGLVPVAKAAAETGADFLGVDDIEEGLSLRRARVKIPILVFGPGEEILVKKAVRADLTLTVYDHETVKMISKFARELKKKTQVHLKVETGMNRYGVLKREVVDFVKFLKRTPRIELEGIYSQLSMPENRDKTYTFRQIGEFNEILELLRREGIKIPIRHLAKSAAALSIPSSLFDMVRLGLVIYGLFPTPGLGTFFDLEPALTLKSRIAEIKKIGVDERVGYGGTYLTKAPTLIAIVPFGYADGYDRGLSNLGKVLIRGERAQVIGRVCMSAIIVDITDVPEAQVGDEVVLIGKQGSEQITAGELAGLLDTINYEIVSRISESLPRVYKK